MYTNTLRLLDQSKSWASLVPLAQAGDVGDNLLDQSQIEATRDLGKGRV